MEHRTLCKEFSLWNFENTGRWWAEGRGESRKNGFLVMAAKFYLRKWFCLSGWFKAKTNYFCLNNENLVYFTFRMSWLKTQKFHRRVVKWQVAEKNCGNCARWIFTTAYLNSSDFWMRNPANQRQEPWNALDTWMPLRGVHAHLLVTNFISHGTVLYPRI